jgi:hypothetical protein
MATNAERSAAAEVRFRARLAELGATLLEPRYLGADVPHRVRCAAGHETAPRPRDLYTGKTRCRVCSGKDPETAEARFRAAAAALGVTILEPRYLGTLAPHHVRYSCGHEGLARPADVRRGQRVCLACRESHPGTVAMRARRAAAAEARFRAALAEFGAEMLEPWQGINRPTRVRCAAGHECRPRPAGVIGGQGPCRICGGNDPAAAEARFRARVAELGGEVLEPRWLGRDARHRVRCAAGHITYPRPSGVYDAQARGIPLRRGICRVCTGHDPETAEARFRARLAELGATLLEPAWLGADAPHRVRCAAGHECRPRPGGVVQGAGVCRVCAGNDQATAGARFRARVAELGGEVLEPIYLGAHAPHRVRCAAGHESAALPHHVRQGGGICRVCAGKTWDAFYVVADLAAGRIKFGITSGDPRPRLRQHRAAGYREAVRVMTGLPGTAAPEIESAALAALALAGYRPVKGREYYDADALAVVLDVADGYPLPASADVRQVAEAAELTAPEKLRPPADRRIINGTGKVGAHTIERTPT